MVTPSKFAAEVEAVGNGEEDGFDAGVGGQFSIQCVDGFAGGLLNGAAAEFATPEHVVEEDQAVFADPGKEQFVVGVVFGFLGVNKRKVKVKPLSSFVRIGMAEPRRSSIRSWMPAWAQYF